MVATSVKGEKAELWKVVGDVKKASWWTQPHHLPLPLVSIDGTYAAGTYTHSFVGSYLSFMIKVVATSCFQQKQRATMMMFWSQKQKVSLVDRHGFGVDWGPTARI